MVMFSFAEYTGTVHCLDSSLTIVVIQQKIYFYKYVNVAVCRFHSSKELKTKFKKTSILKIYCAQV